MGHTIPPDTRADNPLPRPAWMVACLTFSVVLCCALFGILTRPIDFLALLWPANAVLLGMMLRYPALSTPVGWTAACAGFLAADTLTGNPLLITLWLTTTNMTGITIAYLLLDRYHPQIQNMHRPYSVLYLFAACTVAAMAAATIGGATTPWITGRSVPSGAITWFTAELLNYILIVPLFLTCPRTFQSDTASSHLAPQPRLPWWRTLGPVMALSGSMLLSLVVGGPGAIAFPVPALLWCALAYPMFYTAFLTFLAGVFLLMTIALGWIPLPFAPDIVYTTISVRLGVLLLALAPLTVAAVNTARNDLLRSLDHAVSYDDLTQALSRRTFLDRANTMLQTLAQQQRPVGVIMLDIDHFKQLNDTHGHQTGDRVLTEVAIQIRQALRPHADLCGRMGGEEFALMLPDTSHTDTLSLAEQLRTCIAQTTFRDVLGNPLNVSVSQGIHHGEAGDAVSLQLLLSRADAALYRAKRQGRNRVELAHEDDRFPPDTTADPVRA